jgi:hypothetical protein
MAQIGEADDEKNSPVYLIKILEILVWKKH